MKKSLLIQTAFIGDAILASAAVEALAQRGEQVHVLVRKGNEVFFNSHPGVRKVWVWDKSSKWKSWWFLLQQIRKEEFDVLYLVQRYFTMSLFALLSKSKVKWAYDQSVLGIFFKHLVPYVMATGKHEVDRLMDLIQSDERYLPKLYPSVEDEKLVEKWTQTDFITMSPASVWETKRAPENVWKAVAEAHSDTAIYLLGGPGDLDFLSRFQKGWGLGNVQVLAGQLTLLQSAALMKHARMNFVNDSGPLHLCSAMNAPVTAFFCSTVPDFGFGPLSSNSLVLETTEELPCRPCGLHGKKSCPRGDFACGQINFKVR